MTHPVNLKQSRTRDFRGGIPASSFWHQRVVRTMDHKRRCANAAQLSGPIAIGDYRGNLARRSSRVIATRETTLQPLAGPRRWRRKAWTPDHAKHAHVVLHQLLKISRIAWRRKYRRQCFAP